MKYARKSHGFTLVELLIVVIVIAILAAISVVAYSGAQQRGRDAVRTHDIATLQRAIESYNVMNGTYPGVCPGGNGSGCDVSNLATALVPDIIAKVPNDPQYPYHAYNYVRGSATSYGLYVTHYETKPPCKVGVNMFAGWWGAPTC